MAPKEGKEKRAENVRQAQANERIERLKNSIEASENGQRYINGEITIKELTAQGRRRYGLS